MGLYMMEFYSAIIKNKTLPFDNMDGPRGRHAR